MYLLIMLSSLSGANAFDFKNIFTSLSLGDTYMSYQLTIFDTMAVSAQGASKLPAQEQEIDTTASAETTTEVRGAYGDIAPAVHNTAAHAHGDDAPTHGQTFYPSIIALSEEALGAHEANNPAHAPGSTEAWAREQSRFSSTNHHIPPQTPQEFLESMAREEQLERLYGELPVTSQMLEERDQQRREYRHAVQLPPTSAGQTAEQARERALPSIGPLIDSVDVRTQLRTLPAGHLREIPANWVAEQDLSYEHRLARMACLEFEYEIHELDYRLRANIHRLRRLY